jgi:hypothetical protein
VDLRWYPFCRHFSTVGRPVYLERDIQQQQWRTITTASVASEAPASEVVNAYDAGQIQVALCIV